MVLLRTILKTCNIEASFQGQSNANYISTLYITTLTHGFGGTLFIMGAIGTWAFRKEALGFGDIKLGLVLGSFLGTELSLLALFLSFIFAACMSIILLLAKEVGEDHMIPFGPSIATGTLLTILTKTVGGGNHIINWYFTNMWTGEYFF